MSDLAEQFTNILLRSESNAPLDVLTRAIEIGETLSSSTALRAEDVKNLVVLLYKRFQILEDSDELNWFNECG